MRSRSYLRKLRFESLEGRRMLAAEALTCDAEYVSLVEWFDPIPANVPDDDVTSLPYWRFYELTPAQVPLLLPSQIATIPDTTSLNTWPSVNRAALTSIQVQSLQVSTITISLLTEAQRLALLPAQVRSLPYTDFRFLDPSQIPLLTPTQISTIPDTFAFNQWEATARAALTVSQIPALNAATITISLLTTPQKLWLSTAQIHTLPVHEWRHLEVSQIPLISPAQIAGVTNDFTFRMQFSSAQRGALVQSQIQALSVHPSGDVRISWLTQVQAGWLTPAQIQNVILGDYHVLPVSQIPYLTLAQIAAVDQDYTFNVQFSADQRAALTQQQIQAVQVDKTLILWMTVQQRGWLTPSQIGSLTVYDLPHLLDHQIPLVTPAQFALMQDLFVINGWSDAVRAQLTRAQLMALPLNVLSNYMAVEIEQYPPVNYTPGSHAHNTNAPPFPGTLAYDAYWITKEADATNRALSSGNWSTPSVWSAGVVPRAGEKVFIPGNVVITFDAIMTTAIKTLRVDGTLVFRTNVDTVMRVDTIVVGSTGKFHVGTPTAPIADHVTAKVIFPDGGPIDTAWDPGLASRGLISRGEVRMFGRVVTPYATLAVDPMQNHSVLHLTQAPTGWRVGDELVIAGVNPIGDYFDSERATITAVNGTTITLNRGLTYNHDAPDGYAIQVANTNRNVQFLGEEESNAQERPHIAFAESPNAWMENVLVKGFGRTDKTQLVTDPVVVNGVLQSGGANPRARYAVHFHHTGTYAAIPPGILRGNVVVGSPGWGFVNHQGNVVMEYNVAIDVLGASFVGEDGNEIGAMRYNLAMNSVGSGSGGPLTRRAIHDFGHNGHGFWFQGPGIEVVGNIVAGTRSGAYGYFTSSSLAMFDTANLDDPSIAYGRPAIPIGTAPIKRFEDNLAYGVNQGLEIWFHQTFLNDGQSFIDDFTVWNTKFGVQLFYSGQIAIRNATIIGRYNLLPDLALASPTGIGTNRIVHDITFDNVRVEAFVEGLVVPVRRDTTIFGGQFANIRNVVIGKGHDTLRSLNVPSAVEFVPLTSAQINGREWYDVGAKEKLALFENLDRKVESLFSPEELRIVLSNGTILRLYFPAQAADAIPLPTGAAPQIPGLPTAYLGKTNSQLWQDHSVWFGGGNLPVESFVPNRFGMKAVVESPLHPADFNSDGKVEGGDFLAWQRGYGRTNAGRADGDADGNGTVDAVDLGRWSAAFGQTTDSPQIVAAAPMFDGAPTDDRSRRDAKTLAGIALAREIALRDAADDILPGKRRGWRLFRGW
ncbi:MAG: hypothetical protein KF688_16295 [Pirellulales bacterium]|nr:hypothetical protein [Pirellulales bacterium]